ncbi:hypothetical protein [Streptomyces sp. NPDC093260]
MSLTSSGGDYAMAARLFGDEDDPAMCPADPPDDGCPTTGCLRPVR